MLTTIILPLIGGGILLVAGGDGLVRGAIGIAQRFRLPEAVIGVTLVGFGTSTPEFLASLSAALQGSAPIAIGNAVGSNSANILLILGVAALVAPFKAPMDRVRRDLVWMAAAALALAAALLAGGIGRPLGIAFLAGLAVYAVISLRQTAPDEPAVAGRPLWLSAVIAAGGLAGAIVGASFFVEGAVELARVSGLSEAVIGVTVVAVGTSLPELAASVIAALRGASGLALANVLGSNVFNVLGVLGLTAVVLPLGAPAEIVERDLWVMLAATAALVAAIVLRAGVGRPVALAFLLAYAAYLGALAA